MISNVGCTRCVFFVGDYVIKVPKFRLFSIAKRAFEVTVAGEANEHVKRRHKTYFGALKFLLRPRTLNYQEYGFSKAHPRSAITPTVFSFFGLCNIQKRCKRIKEDSPIWQSFVDQWSEDQVDEFDIKWFNYGLLDGRLVCLDYAEVSTQRFLVSQGNAALKKTRKQRSEVTQSEFAGNFA